MNDDILIGKEERKKEFERFWKDLDRW